MHWKCVVILIGGCQGNQSNSNVEWQLNCKIGISNLTIGAGMKLQLWEGEHCQNSPLATNCTLSQRARENPSVR